MIAKTLWASVAIMLIAFANAEYDVAKYCQLVETGTQLPSMTACQTYYICGPDGQPIQANCTAGTVFSKNDQGCVAEANSNCHLVATNPCENKNKQFAPNVQACNQWYYCVNNEIAGSGSCPNGQIFSDSTGSCIYGQCNDGNASTDVQNVCLIMPDGVFFGDNEQCNAWYKCNGMYPKNGTCLDQLVFDAKTGQCLTNDGNMCVRTGGVVSNQTGEPPVASLCVSAETKSIGDKQVCSVYYSCESEDNTLKWVQKKCTNQYFDVLSGNCNSTSQARPYPGCNRCEFTTGNPYWVNDVNTDCSTYSTCKNGQLISKNMHCPNSYYFNEVEQYCVTSNADKYRNSHGACENYSCTDEGVCTVPTAATKNKERLNN